MTWERLRDDEERVEWERSDGYARVVARATATGTWAVSLDRLEQAPDGESYDHRTVENRGEAIEVAAAWRDDTDIE